MRRTSPLDIRLDTTLPQNKIVIHPNEGFDLGLMKDSYSIHIFTNMKLQDFIDAEKDCAEGSIDLLNECPHETVRVGSKLYNQMNQPDRALLVLQDEKILIATV
ncbi:hypothetical protein [Spirochaeta cellobiosiphila]|uniref:hypothetical protein n=1 Tax=Spirochaeta cellobiosiphila TaxID=504483 RepID=UPI00042670C0|nr:hypothetical protein [Spirochaeta cellobiosiphila]